MSTNKKKFNTLANKDELLEFLYTKGKNHNEYHHYTTFDNAIKIIKNKSFFLTRGNSTSMNDQHEPTINEDSNIWDKTYIGSFAFGGNENMAMWGLYGLPKENAVRITIPKKAMESWFDSINEIHGITIENNVPEYKSVNNKFDKYLSDIVYIDTIQDPNLSKLYWNDNSLRIKPSESITSIADELDMIGFIKNFAWKYENEVRLLIRTEPNTKHEKISVNIPEEVTKNISITAGPCFNGDIGERLKENQCDNKVSESIFKGLVNYKILCSMCLHENFINKE